MNLVGTSVLFVLPTTRTVCKLANLTRVNSTTSRHMTEQPGCSISWCQCIARQGIALRSVTVTSNSWSLEDLCCAFRSWVGHMFDQNRITVCPQVGWRTVDQRSWDRRIKCTRKLESDQFQVVEWNPCLWFIWPLNESEPFWNFTQNLTKICY